VAVTAPAGAGGGNELGTVFINVAPRVSGLSNQFLAAGREGAKSFSQGFTEGMKQVSLPADGSILGEVIAGKPVGTATRSAAQKAGKEIGTGLNTGINEGMKVAPSTGGGAISDVIAGKPVGSGTKAAAENAGKEIGASINKGVEEGAKGGKRIEDIIVGDSRPEEAGTSIGKRISGAILDQLDRIGPEGGAAIGERLGQVVGDLAGDKLGGLKTVLDGLEPLAKQFGIDLGTLNDKAVEDDSSLGQLSSVLKTVGDNTKDFDREAPGFEGILGRIGGKAGEAAQGVQGLADAISLIGSIKDLPVLHQITDFVMNMPADWGKRFGDWLGTSHWGEGLSFPQFQQPGEAAKPPAAPPGWVLNPDGTWSKIQAPEPFPERFIGPIPPGTVRAPGGVAPPVPPPPPPPGVYRDWYGGGTPPAETPTPREPRAPTAPREPRAPREPTTGGSSLRSRALSGASDRGGVAAAGSRVANLYALAESLVGTPYSTALRDDCSGIVAELAAVAVGLPVPGPGERFSTVTEEQWLLSHGFQMGMGPPGSLRIGWTPLPGMEGHTAATLPGGEHAEMGGAHGGFVLGAGAAGAESPQFSMHAYLPMAGGRGGAPLGTQKDPIYTSSAEEGEGKGGADQYGQQLGQSIVSGMFQELGFPDVFGKPFTQWGAWKMGMAGLNYGMGLAQMMGGPAGGGAAGGGFGGFHGVPSIVGMAAQAASQRPGAQPLGAPGSPGNTQILNFDLSGGVGRVESGAVRSLQDAVNPAGGNSAATATVGGAQGQPR
jgi:hypothetical protein